MSGSIPSPEGIASAARLRRVTAGLVLLALGAYLVLFAVMQRGLLFDPLLQNDDVRTNLIYFQRFTADHALTDDPISAEMLSLVPLGIRALYRVIVPLTGLYAASKVVQGICFLMILYAGFLIARRDPRNLGPGVLLVFLLLHTPFVVYYIAGGNPRAFTFPCLALWGVGAIVGSFPNRAAAAVIASLTYPSAMAMILAAEGLLALRDLWRDRRPEVARRLAARTGALGAVCAALVMPIAWPRPEIGPPFTLAEAMAEPGYGPAGRLPVLPLPDPIVEFRNALFSPLRPSWPPLLGAGRIDRTLYTRWGALLFFLVPIVLVARRRAEPPWAALLFVLGCVVLYVLSRIFFLRLYQPSRYYMYGMRAAAILIFVETLARLTDRDRPERTALVRDVTAGTLMLALLVVGGSGILPRYGVSIDGREHAALYSAIRALPRDARIASHPEDGDGIPYWGARANMGGHETIQPWFTTAWRRQIARAEETLRALYATDPEALRAYGARNRVTHILVNLDRYGPDFREKARSFEPLSAFTDRLLASADRDRLLLAHVRPEAVVAKDGNWLLVDASRLAAPAAGP